MKVGKTLYAKNRRQWRSWLAKHHKTEREIWLIYYKKASGKPRIPYNDAVEEALCYGWIDSILKPIDEKKYAQRYSPRKKTSKLSDMNRERIRRLTIAGRMTKAGFEAVQRFPASYKRIRVGWIEAARHRRPAFEQRLRYFIKMTKQNKRFGMVQ